MSTAIRELSRFSSLRGRWVAIDSTGTGLRRDDTPLRVALSSGAVVVDADDELDVLCARLSEEKRSSLTIVFNPKRS